MTNSVQKFLAILANGLRGESIPTITGGVANGGNLVALDPATGFLPFSMLPPDIDSAGEAIVASEALSGPLVNVWNNAGTPNARNADAAGGKPATGFIIGTVAANATAEVFYGGKMAGLSAALSLVAGTPLFLGATGAVTATPNTTSGQVLQSVGTATGASTAAFRAGDAVTRA